MGMTKREMAPEKAADEIRRAYVTHTSSTDGEYASIVKLMERMDLTADEFNAGAQHLIRTDELFNLAPEPNQRMLTEADHTYAVRVGNRPNHLVMWQ